MFRLDNDWIDFDEIWYVIQFKAIPNSHIIFPYSPL